MNRNKEWTIGISRARDIEMASALLTEIKQETFGTMNRNESLQLQLATIIQEGHAAKATAYEIAGKVILGFYGAAYDEMEAALCSRKYPAPPENGQAPQK